MPGIWDCRPTRRSVLRFLGTAVAGTWMYGRVHYARGGQAFADSSKLHAALLTDTHILGHPQDEYRGFRPVENLSRAVSEILAARPELALLSGDAARRDGQPGDYRQLRRITAPLAELCPIVIGLGNHDNRDNFFAVFPAEERHGSQSVPGKHVALVEHPVVRIVMLDSLLYVDKQAGLLGKAQRTWLEAMLPKWADRPVVFFVHHTLDDNDFDLLDSDKLFALLAPHRHAKAIFFGHSHRYRIERRQALQLVNLPACGYNFADSEPVGWVDAWFDREGVTLALHALGGNRVQDGKTLRVDWAG